MRAFLESLSDRELVVAGVTAYFIAVAVLGWLFTGREAA